MTDRESKPIDSSDSLIAALRAEVAGEVEAVLASARSEAAAIVRQARQRGRQRFREAASWMRRERKAELTKAEAKASRLRQESKLAGNLEIVGEGLAMIEEAMNETWRDAETRKSWCENAVDLARRKLKPESRIEVALPEDTPEDAIGIIEDACAQSGFPKPTFARLSDITAGLRLGSANVLVDATVAGLMWDRDRIAGEFLALLGSEAGEADG